MTEEKDTAEDIFTKMLETIPDYLIPDNKNASELAKQHALIAVNEIMAACAYNHVESWNNDWWNRVKEELLCI